MNRQLAKQYFDRSEALQEAGKPEEALALLNQLDAAFPNTKNIGLARARAYASMGRVPEAVRLCEELITLHDSRRARELKDRLILGMIDPDAAKPPATKVTGPERNWPRSALKWGAVVGLVAVIAASVNRVLPDSGAVPDRQLARTTRTSSPAEAQLSAPVLDRSQDARSTNRTRRAPGARTPRSAQPLPGQVHPPHTWDLDITGIPKWKSGIFRRVPCIDEPARTINVYLPLAYDEQPESLFPGVVISSPGGPPSFLELETWAERQEVILIHLNSSRNGPGSNNTQAQDAAFRTILPSLRVNQELGFAIGMSGGAMASWLVASRYPDNFSGVVMMGQGGFEDRMLASHIRVAYIRGFHEPNNWYIPRVIESLKRNGNQVRDRLVPGNHVKGPVEVRVAMLNWMVSAARRDLGIPQPSR